ncbi:CBL-interacting protein kinase 32 isoform X2 [Gossypium hirsutum]|uniref:non-specific serine/threonine protein kinase n=1 Tax=Gossypium hirsutum TaxID=3635 RepID=A0ABM3BPM3_GOSHI|nr:CBL-interacting protein kinase 32 isoform X2 [Gossypium hirsutum]
MSQPKIKRRVGKYEMGRTIGEGTFAKVKFARNTETGEPVALKILDKEKVLKHKMAEQIKREIATMKLIKHPNVVRLYEVMGSKTKIFIVLEYVTGGELFDKIVNNGRMREDEARRYFHQLINAVDYCHSRGVYHRDLKDDGLLHTTCGTPNYVAPEVLDDGGYDGATADLWSCGVILFVLLAGYLPFDDSNLMNLYKKISAAEFTCPPWLSFSAMKLITQILDPNPMTRITIPEILKDEWFKKGYKPPVFEEKDDTNLDDVEAVFKDYEEHHVTEQREEQPTAMNAFELISMSKGLNLGNLFDAEEGFKRETRFTSKCPANEIIHKIEEAAKPLGFDVHKKNYKMRLQNLKAGRKGNLNVATEIFQVAPSLHMVEVRKAKGDTLEFNTFYKSLSTCLEDVVWKTEEDMKEVHV